jgi:hypothetical protein
MNLPLRAVPVTDVWVGLWDNNERRICAIYGDYALTDAAAIVAAVNGEAAMGLELEYLTSLVNGQREENARLRAAALGVLKVDDDEDARSGDLQASIDTLRAALDAGGVMTK